MSDEAKKLIEAFDALLPAERRDVVLEILRRAALPDPGFPGDDEFVAAANEVFLELDEHESKE